MKSPSCKTLTWGAAAVLLALASPAIAHNHHSLNGTWVLDPTHCDFGGQPGFATGQLTISDLEHHIYISRTFAYDGTQGKSSYSFAADGNENATIHEGKALKYKARCDGDVLRVTITQEGVPTVEQYSLQPNGRLMVTVVRPGHGMMTLAFLRQ